MTISATKVAIVLGSVGAVGTGSYFVINNLSSTPFSIKESLLKEEYELISSIGDKTKRETQYKNTFLAHRTDSKFLEEINKYKVDNLNITASDEGDKGKVALEKLCNSYLSSNDSNVLENSQKGCVLRIMDKEIPNKTGISIEGGGNESKGKTSFTSNKDLLVSLKINGITNSTDENSGHSVVKTGCATNTKLIINKKNKTTENNAYKICTENKQT